MSDYVEVRIPTFTGSIMTEEATNLSTENGRLPEPWRGLRMYSSSALAELTPDDLADWAGTCRQAIDQFEQLQAEKARLQTKVSDLQALLVRYGDRVRMAKAEPAKRQWLIDEAFEAVANPSSPSGISREDEG